MEETLIKLTPFIIGSAAVPVEIILIILLLSSPRKGLASAIFMVAGMTTIRLLQGVFFGLILSPKPGEASGNSLAVSTLLIVLGIFLLITAYKMWREGDDPDEVPPKWMAALDSLTPIKAFVLGAGLILINVKFWVFTLSAIGVIAEGQLGQPSSTVAFLLFILLAQSLLLLAIIVRAIIPESSKSIMEVIAAWLKKYNRPIVSVFSLIFGMLFFVQGVTGFLSK